MTRWQKFGWALGYTVLSLLSTWYMFCIDAVCIPGLVMVYYFVMALIPLIPLEGEVFFIGLLLPWFLYVAGLLLAPVMAAFRRYWLLWMMLGLSLIGRAVMLVIGIIDSSFGVMMPDWITFVLEVWYALLTVRMLGYPEPEQTAPEEEQPKWYKRRKPFIRPPKKAEKTSSAP